MNPGDCAESEVRREQSPAQGLQKHLHFRVGRGRKSQQGRWTRSSQRERDGEPGAWNNADREWGGTSHKGKVDGRVL
jgi:hypothetical protein